LSNEKYTIAMARTNVPDSATAQFYINVKDNTLLDRANAADKVGYCVFGRVIEGMEAVDKIRQVDTRTQGRHKDVPAQDVVIRTFMIQGGGFEPGMKEKPAKAPIKNESSNGVKNERGTLAMARLGPRDETPAAIQKAADSATSEFFINVVDNDFLDRARAPD